MMKADPHDPAVRRRLYIILARKRVRPGSGSSPDVLWARTWRQPAFDLRSVASVPFLVIGGVATRLYAPERVTGDLDVLVAKGEAKEFRRQVERSGIRWVHPDGMPLDVLEEDAAWVAEALAAPAAGPDGLPVIALPYLILLKMRASRGIDIGDLTRMLGAAGEADLEKTRRVIRTYMSDGEEDLESLIQLSQLEYAGTRDSRC